MQPTHQPIRRPSNLRRYGPIVGVVVIVAIAAVVVAATSGGGDGKKTPVSAGSVGKPPTLFSRDSNID